MMPEDAFFELFHPGLPRLGPGSDADTARALAIVQDLPNSPRILDMGCGNGAQTLALARLLPGARVVAVDRYSHFLRELMRRTRTEGCQDRVLAVAGDMGNPCFPSSSFDLVWSEGAAYSIGFANALRTWRPLLKPGAWTVISHIAWFQAEPSEEARRFWNQEYPDIEDEEALVRHIDENGYSLASRFRLPASSWWGDFYAPLATELARFRERHAGDRERLAVADMVEDELHIHQNHMEEYGYLFLVCRRDK